MPAVDSSAILFVDYNEARNTLLVTFSSGRDYIYLDVPEELYRAFLAAPSPGQFFNLEIRDHYRYREVR
jgi:KTSC domain-containing protein